MRKLLAVLALVLTLALPAVTFAQLDGAAAGLDATASAGYGEEITSDSYRNVGTFIGTFIIQPVLGLVGLIFFVLTIYAGLMWMTSAGDSKRVEKAKGILVAAVTGVVIIASAYIIVNTVLSALTGASTTTGEFDTAPGQF